MKRRDAISSRKKKHLQFEEEEWGQMSKEKISSGGKKKTTGTIRKEKNFLGEDWLKPINEKKGGFVDYSGGGGGSDRSIFRAGRKRTFPRRVFLQ